MGRPRTRPATADMVAEITAVQLRATADRMVVQRRRLIAAAIADPHHLTIAALWDGQCRPTVGAAEGRRVAPVAVEATRRLLRATVAAEAVATVAEATTEAVTNAGSFQTRAKIRRPNLGRRFLLVTLFCGRREIRRVHSLRDWSGWQIRRRLKVTWIFSRQCGAHEFHPDRKRGARAGFLWPKRFLLVETHPHPCGQSW
jgi:hypothetical protein